MCLKRMPNTNYDRFYLDELVKKLKTVEKIQETHDRLEAIPEGDSVPTVVEKFLEIVANMTKSLEQQRADAAIKAKQLEEEAKK